ncbi:MAG: hypothetical protein Tsb0020_04380 [Haliangiales bacterium]
MLIVHDDSAMLDALTRALEAAERSVAIAATKYAAETHLVSEQPIGAVIAGWDAGGGLGREVYRWALENRYDLRDRFVFVADAPPADFDDLVQGRCLLLLSDEQAEIVRVATSLSERAAVDDASVEPGADDIEELDWGPRGKPSLLLVEDDPLQRDWMYALLELLGFVITSVDDRDGAVAKLIERDYEVILCDWYLPGGSGADFYQWLTEERPHLAARCIFMSGAPPEDDAAQRATGRPILPKGQDARTLVRHLRAAVGAARDET